MTPLPLTALHDTLKAGDEPCAVLVTVTPSTVAGVCGVVDVEDDCVGEKGVVFVVDVVTVATLVGELLFGSVMNTTKYNSLNIQSLID